MLSVVVRLDTLEEVEVRVDGVTVSSVLGDSVFVYRCFRGGELVVDVCDWWHN